MEKVLIFIISIIVIACLVVLLAKFVVSMAKEEVKNRKNKLKTEKGFVNVHIDIETKQVFVSNKPYSTREEAECGIMHSANVEKVGCFEIEYTKF